MMEKKVNKIDSLKVARIKVCIISFLFASMGCLLSGDVFSIWLNDNLGLTGTQIGILFSLKTSVAIFYKPIFGVLLDKFQLNKKFILTIPILGVLMGPFFTNVYQPLLMNESTFYLGGLLGGVYFGFVLIAGSASIFNYCDRYIRAHGGTYGVVNAFNAVGWGVMGVVSTFLYQINPVYNFYLISIAALLLTFMFLSLKTKAFENAETEVTTKEPFSFKQVKDLFLTPRFYVLITFVTFITVTLYIQVIQMGRFTVSFWDNKEEAMNALGMLVIVSTVIAFSLSMISSKVIKRLGASKSIIYLSVGVIIYFLVAGISAYYHSKTGVIVSRFVFNSVNPLINVVVLAYVAASFKKGINGTAYLVGFHFMNNLGCTFLGPLIGEIFDSVGFAQGYFELAGVAFIGLMLTGILMSLSHSREKRIVMDA